jgi:putative nucleotidyltransferase with HDIG domain
VRALFVAAVAVATVYLLGLPESGSLEAGERATATVWSDRTVEVPDPVATELERIRAEGAVVPVFVQDDIVPSRVMDGTRRVFREGRRLVQAGADELPGDFVADFYGVFHLAAAMEASQGPMGPDDWATAQASPARTDAGAGTGPGQRPAPGEGPGTQLASSRGPGHEPAATPRTARAGNSTPAPPPGGPESASEEILTARADMDATSAAPGPDLDLTSADGSTAPAAGLHPPSAGDADPAETASAAPAGADPAAAGPAAPQAGAAQDPPGTGGPRDPAGAPAQASVSAGTAGEGGSPPPDPGEPPRAERPGAPALAAAEPEPDPAPPRRNRGRRSREARAGPRGIEMAAADPAASGPGALVRKAAAEGFSERLERSVTMLAVELLGQGLVDESHDAPGFSGRQVTLSRPGARPSSVSYDSFLTYARARAFIVTRARMQAADTLADPGLIADLVMSSVRPNVTLDEASFAERLSQAVAGVAPVVYRVRKGEQVIQEGETVTPRTKIVLEAISAGRDKGWWIKRSAGLLVVLLVFLTVTQAIAGMERRRLSGIREPLLMTFLLMIYIFLAWASTHLGKGFERGFGLASPHTLFLAMPIPTATMLAVIFLGNRRSVPVAFLGAILAAALAPMPTFEAFVYLANGSLVAILHLRHISERGRFLSSAMMCSLINMLTILGLSLMDGRTAFSPELLAGAVSGLASGILASGLVPVVELVMGFTTNLKLMELGNLNRPLLRELMLAAPGTYHHSVIVGSMVEAAAEAIGANPHLARVGAYYHDIGKIRKPLYFIENQAGENRHDSLTPTMSVLILVGHVKDGVEIARAHGLPPQVIDIVEQHHGTSLMSFFLHKAIEHRSPNSPPVNPEDFRYPGPKPASKEAGLVMLADICEAATRSLTEPTPGKIGDLVRALINRIFDDGQLDASELVVKDITETMRIFTNILVGIYHHRVTYPVLNKDAVKNQAARSKVIYGNLAQESAAKRVVTH